MASVCEAGKNKRRIAIIGASELQNPLILKAKEMGLETHVFAWEAGDVGERTADFFYPISITETDAILEKCRELGVSGVCTIASDLANVAVGYVANALGLTGNSLECVEASTNKAVMRRVFEAAGCPSPRSMKVSKGQEYDVSGWSLPLIVKPTDRSGSRGITKIDSLDQIPAALEAAFSVSFEPVALIEEFAFGKEYSVEYLSWQGRHTFLAVTEKGTTGAPHFIETGHVQPALLDGATVTSVREVVEHALDALGVEYGPSHAEVKIDSDGTIMIIEIGSRMGGDCIGSHLVPLTTGIDYVAETVRVALGEEPYLEAAPHRARAEVTYVFNEEDKAKLERIQREAPESLVFVSEIEPMEHEVTDSSTRFGFYITAEAERV